MTALENPCNGWTVLAAVESMRGIRKGFWT
jgi:hypothetical protein